MARARESQLDNFQELAEAIVVQAARDYRAGKKLLFKNPNSQRGKELVEDVIRFFRSEWIMVLTNVDGTYIQRKLDEELKEWYEEECT